MCQSKEEVMLSRLQELQLTVRVDKDIIKRHKDRSALLDGTLDVAVKPALAAVQPGSSNTAAPLTSPEETFARFVTLCLQAIL